MSVPGRIFIYLNTKETVTLLTYENILLWLHTHTVITVVYCTLFTPHRGATQRSFHELNGCQATQQRQTLITFARRTDLVNQTTDRRHKSILWKDNVKRIVDYSGLGRKDQERGQENVSRKGHTGIPPSWVSGIILILADWHEDSGFISLLIHVSSRHFIIQLNTAINWQSIVK